MSNPNTARESIYPSITESGHPHQAHSRDTSSISTVNSQVNWSELARGIRQRTNEKKKAEKAKERRQKRFRGINDRRHEYSRENHHFVLFIRRFKCLFWGNMFFRHRYRIVTLFEIFFPPLFCMLMFFSFTRGVTWNKIAHERNSPDIIFKSISTESLYDSFIHEKDARNADNAGRIKLIYSPNNSFTNDLIQDALHKMQIGVKNQCNTQDPHVGFGCHGVPTATEVIELSLFHRADSFSHGIPIGIIFNMNDEIPRSPKFKNITGLPLNLVFSISTFHSQIAETADRHPFTPPPRNNKWQNPYHHYGFLGLQAAIESSFLDMVWERTSKIIRTKDIKSSTGIYLEEEKKIINCVESVMKISQSAGTNIARFLQPHFQPNYFDENARRLISNVMIIVLVLSYMSISYFIVRQIVVENQSRIKDLLQMHTLPYYYHWIILIAHGLLFRTMTAALVAGTLYIDYGNGAIVSHSDYVFVFGMIWIHLLSLSCFNFFLATIMTSINFSGIYGVSICVLSFAFPAMLQKSDFMGFTPNLILCLFLPNWCLENFARLLTELECDERGLNSETFSSHSTHSHSSRLQCSEIGGILFVSALVYLIVAILNDFSKQKKLETNLKWYQFIERFKRWRKRKPRPSAVGIEDTIDDNFPRPRIYDDRNLSTDKCQVHVRHLSKLYGKHRLVLDDISMNFAQGEITVILGHTDSGKSTFIQCLAGLVIPTSGIALINGFNVVTESAKARQYLGLCPQEVITFNLLTVQEHLVLCYKLRGLNSEDANSESGNLIRLLRLQDVRDRVPADITKDEERKLALALCLVDSPSVILLDEPTLGMGLLQRREIWAILKELKKEGHTIILSTNMMDEAEILGDRIALFSHGKLICYGSPFYLKDQYDSGFVLRIIPGFKFFMNKLNALGKKHFGKEFKERNIKTVEEKESILVELPAHHVAKFADLFDDIEKEKYHMGIYSYGVEQVSLSDVFIKICETVNTDEFTPDLYERKNSKTDEWTSTLGSQLPTFPREEKIISTNLDHFYALLRKHWTYSKSRVWVVCFEFLIPLIIILIAVLESHIFVTPAQAPMIRKLDLGSFPRAKLITKIAGKRTGQVDWDYISHEVIGDFYDSTLDKDTAKGKDIGEFLKEEFEGNKNGSKFHPEVRMMALELLNQNTEFLGWFSSSSLHSAPTVMNMMANIILRGITNNMSSCDEFLPPEQQTEKEIYNITVINAPFPSVKDQQFVTGCTIRCLLFSMIVSLSCGFIAATNINMPIEERANGMKQVQIMAGVSPWIYWLSIYVGSIMFYGFTSVLITLIFSLDWVGKTFQDPQVKLTLLLFVGIYLCWSSIPWTFFLSTIIPSNLSGYKFVMTLHVLLGLIPDLILKNVLVSSSVTHVPEHNPHYFLNFIFYLFPPYSITAAFQDWFEIVSLQGVCNTFPSVIREMCDKEDDPSHANDVEGLYKFILDNDLRLGQCCKRICSNPRRNTTACFELPPLLQVDSEMFSNPRLLTDILSLLFQGILYWLLLIITEKRIIGNFVQAIVLRFVKSQERRMKLKMQADIRLEKQRVSTMIMEGKLREVALICHDLTKSYATHMVINNVNLTLNKGETVGLLGGSGSGRSTVIQMLAGEVIPTRGTAFIGEFNLQIDRKKYLENIGYCPQSNCVFDNFTGVQMMELIGRIKGVPYSLLAVHIKKWLQIFGLAEAAQEKCKEYSPSMKRRLCISMALIGGNQIFLFDEATAGFDPAAKLRFWSVVKQLAAMGHSILFTTYNVDECTKLGSRLLVLSEGNVQCVGTPAQLRQRFSRGFCLLIRLRYDTISPLEIISSSVGRVIEVKKSVHDKFKHATLRDEQDVLLLYFLRDTKLTWGDVFRKAEEIKNEHSNIVDNYFISQASLEDVFILLTNKYRELDKPRRMEPSIPGELTKYELEKEAYEAATKKLLTTL